MNTSPPPPFRSPYAQHAKKEVEVEVEVEVEAEAEAEAEVEAEPRHQAWASMKKPFSRTNPSPRK